MTISLNHKFSNSMDPGAINLGDVFWVSTSGSRRRLHTLLSFFFFFSALFTQFTSFPFELPECYIHFHPWQMSHGKHLQPQAKCRSGAAGPLETLLYAGQVKFICGEGSLWVQVLRRTWNSISGKKACTKGFGVLGFFWMGEGLVLFVCLWFWLFAGLFYAYLWN